MTKLNARCEEEVRNESAALVEVCLIQYRHLRSIQLLEVRAVVGTGGLSRYRNHVDL